MSKDYYVLRGGRVVYRPGHYDLEGARKTALAELIVHPKATVIIVQKIETRIAKEKEIAEDKARLGL